MISSTFSRWFFPSTHFNWKIMILNTKQHLHACSKQAYVPLTKWLCKTSILSDSKILKILLFFPPFYHDTGHGDTAGYHEYNDGRIYEGDISWAASSEFVSSSIPSWQILTAHAQPLRRARDLAFCLKVLLDSLLVCASSGGSGETARMRRLAWTFAARIAIRTKFAWRGPRYLITVSWPEILIWPRDMLIDCSSFLADSAYHLNPNIWTPKQCSNCTARSKSKLTFGVCHIIALWVPSLWKKVKSAKIAVTSFTVQELWQFSLSRDWLPVSVLCVGSLWKTWNQLEKIAITPYKIS